MWHKIPSHPHIPTSPHPHIPTSPHPRITTSEDPPTSCLGSKHVVPNRHLYYSQSIHPKLSPTPCSLGQCESHSAVINGPSQHPNPSAATPYDPTTHPDYSHPTPSYARVYVCMYVTLLRSACLDKSQHCPKQLSLSWRKYQCTTQCWIART